MKIAKVSGTVLLVCALLIMTSLPTYADSRYVGVTPGKSVEISNGDGTCTHFVLDALAAGQPEFAIDSEWWRQVYAAVKREVQRIAPFQYNERNEDIILLLHSRPMDHLKIASLKIRLLNGQVFKAGDLAEEQALRCAQLMFIEPEAERDYIVKGWFFWTQSKDCDIMALDCRDDGEITIHELAHAFTVMETTTEEREAIAIRVLEALNGNKDFMALLGTSSITPHLASPVLVDFEDFLKSIEKPE